MYNGGGKKQNSTSLVHHTNITPPNTFIITEYLLHFISNLYIHK